MYLALARKYRPQDFTQVIGQDAVVHTLGNAIQFQRIHHAYLFCGARGVGKTSMARIFAKSLNCEKGPTLTPCQTCDLCQAITRGSSMDVIEIDGASNTGVDNIRELREQVKYAPNDCRYKIYIIDEVHMLSTSAFNALLKTLEEPPEHVIFVFATTEPHKIPITILSRCQRYDFRKVSTPILLKHLKKVLEAESVKGEEAALHLIAECAQGSVRDAMSLVDQVIGASPDGLIEKNIRALLGLGDRLLVQNAFTALVTGDLTESLRLVQEADTLGLDLKLFSEDLLKMYHQLILLLSTGSLGEELSPVEHDFFKALAQNQELSLLLAQYQILYRGIFELAQTDFQKTSLEITCVKISQAAQLIDLTTLITELKERAGKGAARPSAASAPSRRVSAAASAPVKVSVAAPVANQQDSGSHAQDWYELVKWIKAKKPPLGGLLNDAVPIEFSAQKIVVAFQPDSPSHNLMIERKLMIEELLTEHFGGKPQFEVTALAEQKKKALSFAEKLAERQSELEAKAKNEVLNHAGLKDLFQSDLARIKEITITKKEIL